jgi:hypothetical protein
MIRRSASSISCRRIPILSIIGIIKKKINLPMIGLESSFQTGNGGAGKKARSSSRDGTFLRSHIKRKRELV